MKGRSNRRHRWFRARIAILGVGLLCVAALVLVRAFQLQVVGGDRLREMAEGQHLRLLRVSPRRGAIYDRHGAELAVSVDVDSVYANPRRLRAMDQDPARTARRLAAVLDVDAKQLASRLATDRYFVWIARRVTPHEATRIAELDIPGIGLTTEARRYYPNRHLAAHLLGFADIDGRGIEGIELAFENELRGSDRRVEAIRDRRGQVVFADETIDDLSKEGQNVVLTIDKAIQHIAERELALGVRTFEARGGSVVVMDPSTGEILALANYPPFNPNEPSKHPTAHRRNRAVVDRFEPGSTVKPFTMAAALTAGAVRPDQSINCENGVTRIGGRRLHDAHPYEWLTPTQILAYSSNIGTAKIALELGKRDLYRSFRRFGFGDSTRLGVPGEAAGILRHYRSWYEIDVAAVSFGQGMSVTNVQLATAMSAIANGGRLMRPTLVRRITDARGATLEETKPQVRRQVVPRRVAKLVGEMLTAVTEPGGTAMEAAVDGYLVAGKTGTAQKADYIHGGYAKDKWLASFIGFAPADKPSVAISVVIDEPIIAHYGGTVAGPVFRRIAEVTLRHMGVAPDRGRAVLAEMKEKPEAEPAAKAAPTGAIEDGQSSVPDVRRLPLRRAVLTLHAESLVPEVSGSGLVVRQDPLPGSVVSHGATVRLQLDRRSLDQKATVSPKGSPSLAAAVPRRPHEP
ncbi:MAG: transpeptidase family protein [Myxococcales bacterium]|nr:transpeptidase family protein [Myxococcales bacterium]